MKKRLLALFPLVGVHFVAIDAMAETDLQVFTGVSQIHFDLEESRGVNGIDLSDSFSSVRFGFSAYRVGSEHSSWGFVVEVERGFGRDADQGSGQLIGVRPINWRYQWTESFNTQLFFGAAQYRWEENANGYYGGATFEYALSSMPVSVSVEAKYYYDLNYDTNNGDLFINGPALGVNVGYRF